MQYKKYTKEEFENAIGKMTYPDSIFTLKNDIFDSILQKKVGYFIEDEYYLWDVDLILWNVINRSAYNMMQRNIIGNPT